MSVCSSGLLAARFCKTTCCSSVMLPSLAAICCLSSSKLGIAASAWARASAPASRSSSSSPSSPSSPPSIPSAAGAGRATFAGIPVRRYSTARWLLLYAARRASTAFSLVKPMSMRGPTLASVSGVTGRPPTIGRPEGRVCAAGEESVFGFFASGVDEVFVSVAGRFLPTTTNMHESLMPTLLRDSLPSHFNTAPLNTIFMSFPYWSLSAILSCSWL
mmetsp:Transcript_129964/g.224693  ORF Transcript_129964/g.224693 Transcript_129964/m.224693 type:complete len:217 (-) Transcript_129964:88-738(-)